MTRQERKKEKWFKQLNRKLAEEAVGRTAFGEHIRQFMMNTDVPLMQKSVKGELNK